MSLYENPWESVTERDPTSEQNVTYYTDPATGRRETFDGSAVLNRFYGSASNPDMQARINDAAHYTNSGLAQTAPLLQSRGLVDNATLQQNTGVRQLADRGYWLQENGQMYDGGKSGWTIGGHRIGLWPVALGAGAFAAAGAAGAGAGSAAAGGTTAGGGAAGGGLGGTMGGGGISAGSAYATGGGGVTGTGVATSGGGGGLGGLAGGGMGWQNYARLGNMAMNMGGGGGGGGGGQSQPLQHQFVGNTPPNPYLGLYGEPQQTPRNPYLGLYNT
jgi:hypothetical protein